MSSEQPTAADEQLQKALRYTRQGWPEHACNTPLDCMDFHSARESLTEHNGLLLFRDRITVPTTMRRDILEKLHDGHQGIVKCMERARISVWWPGINAQIKELVANCEFCQVNKRSQGKEPLKPTELPGGPWQKIAADLCEYEGQRYLIVIDYFSRYLEIAHMPTTTASQVIRKLKAMLGRWGIPKELITDNGPQFVATEFTAFSKEYGFIHHTSSPYHPQSNGEAERGVQIAKRILKQEDPLLALMTYRDTPSTPTGKSPNQLMIGRRIQTRLPTLDKNLKVDWPEWHSIKEADAKAKASYARSFNKRHGATELTPLEPGDQVRVKLDSEKSWSQPATVQSQETPRSYTIQAGDGRYRRNRRQLQLIPPIPDRSPETTKLDADDCTMVQPPDHAATTIGASTPVARRSTRETCKPAYLQDYVT